MQDNNEEGKKTMKEILEYQLKQNRYAIESKMAKINKAMKELQVSFANDDWTDYQSALWTDGHVAQAVTALTSLITRQKTLMELYQTLEN